MKGFAAHCVLQKHVIGSRAGIVVQVVLKAKEVHECGTKEKVM